MVEFFAWKIELAMGRIFVKFLETWKCEMFSSMEL